MRTSRPTSDFATYVFQSVAPCCLATRKSTVNTWKATPYVSQVNLAWWDPKQGRSPEYIWRKATREQEDGLHSPGSREKPRYGVRHDLLPLPRHRREKPCC